jgi:hypothetical protein
VAASAGHRWRWEFERVACEFTQITETIDQTTAKARKLLEIFGQSTTNAAGITRTLLALGKRFSA